jgi:hypothetical protein
MCLSAPRGLFGAPATRIVTNRAAGVSPRISSAKCVLLWVTAAEALAQSDPVWLVQRVVAEEMPAVLDKQGRHQGRGRHDRVGVSRCERSRRDARCRHWRRPRWCFRRRYTAGSIVLHPATGRASSSRIDGRAIAKVCGSRSLEPGSGAGHLPYMPNRARRTALTASAGPLTSTCAAR